MDAWLIGTIAGAFVFGFVLGRVSSGRDRRCYVGQAPGQRAPRYAATPEVGDDIRALLTAGQTIEAIKRYREVHGVGLKEAKDAIDALRQA